MKIQEFQIRLANETDVDAITLMIDGIKREMDQPEWFVASDRAYVEQHISTNGFTMVAETTPAEGGIMAAVFVVDFPGDTPENLGHELALDQAERNQAAHMDTAVVLPEYRGNQLQRRLLEAAEQEAARRGITHFMCTIHPANRYSLNSMMSHGYRIIGTKEMYGGYLRHILYKQAKQEMAIGAPVVLVSACLQGVCCRYNGKGAVEESIKALMPAVTLIPVCPEIMGGLATPREPAERLGDRILTKSGEDVTAEYKKGAVEVLKLAKLYGSSCAILKERSPSCGSGTIYDGTHNQKLTNGDGITAELLKQNGIRIFGESNSNELKDFMAHI